MMATILHSQSEASLIQPLSLAQQLQAGEQRLEQAASIREQQRQAYASMQQINAPDRQAGETDAG